MGALLCRGDGRGDASPDLRRGAGDQYGLRFSSAGLAVVLRAGVSPYGRRGPVRAWASSRGSFCGPANRHPYGAAHAMGATPLGALVGTRGGPGRVAPRDARGDDGLVALTPRGVGDPCLPGTGVSVSRRHAGGMYGSRLASATGWRGRAATAGLMG